MVRKEKAQKTISAFCTTTEVAQLLNCSVKTAQLWATSGVLQAWKTPGGHRRITRESVQLLLAQGRHTLDCSSTTYPNRQVAKFQLLIVDSDQRMRRLFELTLSHWGLPLDLIIVRDGFAGLLRMGESRPDMLIIDLDMTGLNVFHLVATLHRVERYREVDIVGISGRTAAQIRLGGRLPKSVLVLSKPVPFAVLREMIETLLVGSGNGN